VLANRRISVREAGILLGVGLAITVDALDDDGRIVPNVAR